jgi:hypothetical protein
MSFARILGREEAVTEKTFSDHALSSTYTLSYPFQVLTGAKAEFKLNMIQEVVNVRTVQALSFVAVVEVAP